jgi:dolichol-phosphate mannosyltransferase
VPASSNVLGDETAGLTVVPDFPAAEQCIARGTDSATVVVLHGQGQQAAVTAAQQGIAAGRGPTPSRPHSFPFRSLVVVPTYNERGNLEAIVREILAYLDTDVLVVDDASPDGTGELADGLAAADPRIQVLHRQGKQGLGTAYLAGFAHAIARQYDRVYEMDADFSHPPWDLPRLCAASADADLVLGSRYVKGGSTIGWDLKRRMLSRGANLYARTILTTGVRDMTGGFRCYRVPALAKLDLSRVNGKGYAFQIEMVFRMVRAGCTVREIPIHFVDRRVGQSKMNAKIAREALWLVPKLRLSGAKGKQQQARGAGA